MVVARAAYDTSAVTLYLRPFLLETAVTHSCLPLIPFVVFPSGIFTAHSAITMTNYFSGKIR